MKRLSTIIISILILLTLLPVVPVKSQNSTKIILQANEKNAGPAELKRSAEIISQRLNLYGINHLDIKVSEVRRELEFKLPAGTDMETVGGLITSSGNISFYETYTQSEIQGLLSSDNQLKKLLDNLPDQKSSDPRAGCAGKDRFIEVENYLRSAKSSGNCLFMWGSESSGSVRCLFALKLNDGGKALISRSEIDSVKAAKTEDKKDLRILIKLNEKGKVIFAEATKRDLHKAIAIVIDNKVFSWPVVQSEITGGQIEVTGSFTENEIKYLPVLFNTERLPLDFNIVK
jgi:preprotein translocase subunit SecD